MTRYAICRNCGFGIEHFTEADLKNPVREKRLKYLLTRDQTCPNCVMTIPKCDEITAEEADLPIFRAEVPEGERAAVLAFAQEKQYIVVTAYTVAHSQGRHE